MKNIFNFLTVSLLVTGSTSAFAAITNLENPLYLPKSGEVYSKTGAAVMYKRADNTQANKQKHHNGEVEFPVWRFTEDLGVGLTDRLTLSGRLGYTQNNSVNRKGMHRGRLGLTYRPFESSDGFIWDVYGEAYLSGLQKMEGKYSTNGFTYDNFSNGRWGAIAGTKFGKKWDKLTLSFFGEFIQTFGNHNNKIMIDPNLYIPKLGKTMGDINFPSEISVDLKSTQEVNWGINAFYQLNKSWSIGGAFEFNQHTDNGVTGVHTNIDHQPAKTVSEEFVKSLKDMNDGWDEYILKASIAKQFTDTLQVALFGEYTFDSSHTNSQNGTDIKFETGLRLNLRF